MSAVAANTRAAAAAASCITQLEREAGLHAITIADLQQQLAGRDADLAVAATRVTEIESHHRAAQELRDRVATMVAQSLRARVATLEAELARRRVADTLAAGDPEDDVYSSASSASEAEDDPEQTHRKHKRYIARDSTEQMEQ